MTPEKVRAVQIMCRDAKEEFYHDKKLKDVLVTPWIILHTGPKRAGSRSLGGIPKRLPGVYSSQTRQAETNPRENQ